MGETEMEDIWPSSCNGGRIFFSGKNLVVTQIQMQQVGMAAEKTCGRQGFIRQPGPILLPYEGPAVRSVSKHFRHGKNPKGASLKYQLKWWEINRALRRLSFIQQIFTAYLLCASPWSGCQKNTVEQHSFFLNEDHILVGMTKTEEKNKNTQMIVN